MRRGWGNSGKGGDEDESCDMVVGNGVTEDNFAVEDRRMTVSVVMMYQLQTSTCYI